MLGEEDDHFITSEADSHVLHVRIRHCELDELTHHEMQVKRSQLRSQDTNDELEQIQRLDVDISVVILEQLSHKKLQWLQHLTCLVLVYCGSSTLDLLLDLYNCLESLLWIWHLQLGNKLITSTKKTLQCRKTEYVILQLHHGLGHQLILLLIHGIWICSRCSK